MRLHALVLVSLGAVTCTPRPAPAPEPKPHPYFPITAGSTHALGSMKPDDGEVKCTSCHLLTQTNYAQFECTGCHAHSKDVAQARHAGVDGYRWESGACYGCHGNGTASRIRHDPAHDLSVTWLTPTFSGNTIVSVTPVDGRLPMEMNHDGLTLPCASCHVNAALGDFYPGQFHPSLDALELPQPTACLGCHASAAPPGFVGAIDARRSPASPEMRHDVDAGRPPECSACHVAPSRLSDAGWSATAAFHSVAQPGACVACHANSRPTGRVDVGDGGLKIDHGGLTWLGECGPACHSSFATWGGGRFHAVVGTPASCLPCHDGERPAAERPDAGPRALPFDFGTSDAGVRHVAGLDCAGCHASTQGWTGGFFSHAPGTLASTTCVACHATQRPQVPDHSVIGSGDCFGCHRSSADNGFATWDSGQSYPGANLISSSTKLIVVSSLSLKRSDAGFVTGTAPTTVTLYNAMQHTSVFALDAGPAPGDPASCSLCHAGSPPNSLAVTTLGEFHSAVPVQPTLCDDCHAGMRPPGLVARTMDHAFGAALDCWACHLQPGVRWSDGVFHPRVDATGADCVSCHYPLMADAGAADVSEDGGRTFAMKHAKIPFQRCDGCHPTALASQRWEGGVFHASLATQPGSCVDCHAGISTPAPNATMNHGAAIVATKDCALCHSADAALGAFSPSTKLHPKVTPSACAVCHASRVPPGLFPTPTITTASASTGVSGRPDQIAHTDVNVSSRECNFCHTQPGAQWSGAAFHSRFAGSAALLMNGSTGRCSNCHLDLAPGPTFTAQDHAGLSADPGSTDCSACHQWPGTGGATAPNWRRAGSGPSAPQALSVGGFAISKPPAPSSGTTTQAGLNGLSHPAVPAGGSCTSCHATASGGRHATGYDHALAPATGCAACHEAGSDLVGTPWVLAAPGAVMVPATCSMGSGMIADRGGDTRPIGLTALACTASPASRTCGERDCLFNHFYPSDCGECHRKPPGVPAVAQTGAAYADAWRFVHSFGAPVQSATCSRCH